MSLTVVGLDPSLTASGVAWSDGTVKLHGKKGVTGLPLVSRAAALNVLATELYYMITGRTGAREVRLVVIEEFVLNMKSSSGVSERAHLWWSVVDLLRLGGVPVLTATPGDLKRYATGSGTATKAAVVDAVARRLPQFETKGDENLADAAVLCALGMDLLGQPLTEMPAKHRTNLNRLIPPERIT